MSRKNSVTKGIELSKETLVEQELKRRVLTLLKDRHLLQKIGAEFDKKIVGEKDNRIAIFLNACGKWVINAAIASYNLCLNSNSGAGKDYVCKNVLTLFPKEEVVFRSRISPTAFTYWHNSKFEPEWSWNGKIALLSDISNSILNCEVFKLMCSDGTSSTVVINQQAVDIIINGKPVLFITTASSDPNNEMLRRFPILELDETIDQTKLIKKRQAENAASGATSEYDPIFSKALGSLKRVKVKIPFATDLPELLPDSHIIMRTHFNRLLDYIKASAALHQYQRETDKEGYILATGEDYDNAIVPLKATTSNPIMIPLTKKQKMLLDVCKTKGNFSVKDLLPDVPFLVQSKVYEALDKLQEFGFLTCRLEESETSKKDVRFYEYVPFTMEEMPKWEILTCRKKGIEGGEGNKGIKGNEGKDGDSNSNENNNSRHSLNSPPKLTLDDCDWPAWNFLNEVTNTCAVCQQSKSCNLGPDNKNYCYSCAPWLGKVEEVSE